MAYSVLAIAPIVPTLPALSTAAELARIGDLPGVTLAQLTGPVTKQRIIDRLGRSSYDAVLWTGHGTPGHLLIEGDTVDPRWLAVQLKQASVKLVVLAACQSGNRPAITEFVASFADVLPTAGITTIAMMIDVSDSAAIDYDVALFQSLAAGETIRRAHEVGVEAIAHSGAMVQAPMLIPADKVNGDFARLQENVPAIGKALAANDLQQAHILIGDTMATLGRIDRRITGIEVTITGHETRIVNLERHANPPPLVVALRFCAAFVIVFGAIFGCWQYESMFILNPIFGLALEGAIAGLALMILLYSNSKLREYTK